MNEKVYHSAEKFLEENPELSEKYERTIRTIGKAKQIVDGHLHNMLTAAEIAEVPAHIIGQFIVKAGLDILCRDCYVSELPISLAKEIIEKTVGGAAEAALCEAYERKREEVFGSAKSD